MKKVLSQIITVLLCTYAVHAQSPVTGCGTATPFCTDTSNNITYQNTTGQSSQSGPNYGCLYTQPNATWFYFQIGQSGTLAFTISQTNTSGNPIDVDFAMWGPFSDLSAGCSDIMNGNLDPTQCSYSASATENVGIGVSGGYGSGQTTPPPGISGQYYIVTITNYSNQPGTISFTQTGGTGNTNCNLACNVSTSNSGPVCVNNSVQLVATGMPDTPYNGFWTGPNGFYSTDSITSTPVLTTAGTYDYVFMAIKNNDTCADTTHVTVYGRSYNTINKAICYGESYEGYNQTGTYLDTFQNVHGCDSIRTITLKVNPINFDTLNYTICDTESVLFADSFFRHTVYGYTHTFTNQYGCDSFVTLNLTVNPRPDVEITSVSSHDVCIGDTVHFTASDQPYIPHYTWYPVSNFDRVSMNTIQNPSAIVDSSQYFKVEVINQYGCKNYDSVLIAAHPCCDISMPTAFSPNGDGINDVLKPVLETGQKLVVFKIYNRKGQVIFESSNPAIGWDGTSKNTGTAMPIDTYMYYIEYSCTDGKNYLKKGDITLIK